jgi:hypothetical protein
VSPLPANGEDYSVDLLGMLNTCISGDQPLTEPTEHHDDDKVWELTLADEDDPECSLVELLAVHITVHVEILNDEAAGFEKSGGWSREQRGGELAQDDAMRCLALIARRQPDALHCTAHGLATCSPPPLWRPRARLIRTIRSLWPNIPLSAGGRLRESCGRS